MGSPLAEVAVECVRELAKRLRLGVTEGCDTRLDVSSRGAAIVLINGRNIGRIGERCRTLS